MLPTDSEMLPTAPMADFNNAIIDVIHARPLELLFGIPALILLVISAIMLIAMLRHSR